jgi:hypothetical protein
MYHRFGQDFAASHDDSVDATTLLDVSGYRGRLSAHELERWRVDSGFAERNGAVPGLTRPGQVRLVRPQRDPIVGTLPRRS